MIYMFWKLIAQFLVVLLIIIVFIINSFYITTIQLQPPISQEKRGGSPKILTSVTRVFNNVTTGPIRIEV